MNSCLDILSQSFGRCRSVVIPDLLLVRNPPKGLLARIVAQFSRTFLLAPWVVGAFSISNSHWGLLLVNVRTFFSTKKIFFLESGFSGNQMPEAYHVQAFFSVLHAVMGDSIWFPYEDVLLERKKIPRQKDGWSCGFRALYAFYSILNNRDLMEEVKIDTIMETLQKCLDGLIE